MVIKIINPDVSENIQTFLSEDYTSGTTLTVDSSSGFANGNYIIVGEPGLEKTEVVNLSTSPPTDTTLTIGSSLKFSHAKGTPVYYTRWDKYELVYRTSSSGSWTTYSSMPASLSFEALQTEYRDSAATTTYQWKYRYYSTEKSAYSGYSDTILATGWPRKSVGYMVREIRKIINDLEKKTVSDTEIIRFLNAAQDKIYALFDRWWFLLKEGTVINTEASTKKYSLPSDFGRMNRVLYRYQDDTSNPSTDIKYNLKYITQVEYDYEARDQTADDSDEVKYYTIYPPDSNSSTGYLMIWPTPETAGLDITPWYYKKFTDLDSYGDETEVPIPSILEDYALAQIYKIRKEEAKAEYYDSLFREQLGLLKLEQKKQTGALRQIWRYEGRRAKRRLYGTRNVYSDEEREKYW